MRCGEFDEVLGICAWEWFGSITANKDSKFSYHFNKKAKLAYCFSKGVTLAYYFNKGVKLAYHCEKREE